MKIPTSEAARRLGMHPANFLRAVSGLVGGLGDCWPEIDDGYVETLRELRDGWRNQEQGGQRKPSGGVPELAGESRATVSEGATRVLDKLARQGRWGTNMVSLDTLKNHYCRGVPDIEAVLEEVLQRELVVSPDGRWGPFSLNPDRKVEIERIVSALRVAR